MTVVRHDKIETSNGGTASVTLFDDGLGITSFEYPSSVTANHAGVYLQTPEVRLNDWTTKRFNDMPAATKYLNLSWQAAGSRGDLLIGMVLMGQRF